MFLVWGRHPRDKELNISSYIGESLLENVLKNSMGYSSGPGALPFCIEFIALLISLWSSGSSALVLCISVTDGIVSY